MKRTKYFIQDWAGNECFGGRTFAEFEDAWGYIYKQARKELRVKPSAELTDAQEKEFNEICGEYSVEEVES